ncbi:Asp23/Gls24 family envelope stress response protein [Paenalkalicoccus suaedae]|uniref:Asp23/Gls24 family envelope stress response protein n=1 Tax=Paenalkalicoccus suaedae TaxID=2592382 RepID=A0A859FE11_9BACI|nr:Asp23/Gls24 family envelope stress response protein [Paenalkalicoccus suaedae]QKS70962.1 Asp23/Gls24 family envelope stress response protein [Paenalkalicoccus suaedae]
MTDNHQIEMAKDKEQLGNVEISPEVIEVIAGIAASEIDGVAALRGNFAAGVAERLSRKSAHSKGVKVELTEKGVKIDVYVVTQFGFSIPDVGKKVQENIVQTLSTMTAIDVVGTDVHITGVQFEQKQELDEKKKPQAN